MRSCGNCTENDGRALFIFLPPEYIRDRRSWNFPFQVERFQDPPSLRIPRSIVVRAGYYGEFPKSVLRGTHRCMPGCMAIKLIAAGDTAVLTLFKAQTAPFQLIKCTRCFVARGLDASRRDATPRRSSPIRIPPSGIYFDLRFRTILATKNFQILRDSKLLKIQKF